MSQSLLPEDPDSQRMPQVPQSHDGNPVPLAQSENVPNQMIITEDRAEVLRGLRGTKRKFLQIYGKVLLRWLLSAIIAAAIGVVLWQYSNAPVESNARKRQFNAIITGLFIAIGLSVATALDEMVADMRWWILSRRYRSRRKVCLLNSFLGLTAHHCN